MVDKIKYRRRYQELIDWYQSSFSESMLTSAAGTGLRVARQKRPGSTVVAIIVTGRTEFIEKYLEFARNLSNRDLSICIYDHCGQGGSGRLLADVEKGYIDRFETYISDLHLVIKTVTGGNTPVYLISHSLGGTISVLYTLKHPDQVKRLVLGSPMLAIRTGVSLPLFIVENIVAAACKTGLGERYVHNAGPYNPDQPYENNLLTSDRDRFLFNRFLSNHLDYAQLGGPTYRWVHEAFKAMRTLKRSLGHVPCPILALAASEDRVIDVKAVDHLASLASDCTLKKYDNARHELFMEKDQTRNNVLSRIKKIFEF